MYSIEQKKNKCKHYYEYGCNDPDIASLYNMVICKNNPSGDIITKVNKMIKTNNNIRNRENTCCDELLLIIQKITNQLIEEEKKPAFGNAFAITKETINMTIPTIVSSKHVLYIQKYGVPNDGIFLQTILDTL